MGKKLGTMPLEDQPTFAIPMSLTQADFLRGLLGEEVENALVVLQSLELDPDVAENVPEDPQEREQLRGECQTTVSHCNALIKALEGVFQQA